MAIKFSRTITRLFLGVVILLIVPSLRAADSIVASFNASLIGRQLFLRNFSASTAQTFVWKDDHLVEQTSFPAHALAVFVPRKISENGSKITLRGDRFVAMLDAAKQTPILSPIPDEITLRIDLKQPADSMTAQEIEQSLFFSGADDAVKSVPQAWKTLVPFGSPLSKNHPGNLVETETGWIESSNVAGSYKPPVPLRWEGQPVPTQSGGKDNPYSLLGVQIGVVACLVDRSGAVRDIWILIPLTQVAESDSFVIGLATTVFQPATLQDHPIRSIMVMEDRWGPPPR